MTHMNAFKSDLKEALGSAHNALAEAEVKVNALFEKLDADELASTPVAPAPEAPAQPTVPAAPSDEAAKPAPVRDAKGHFVKSTPEVTPTA